MMKRVFAIILALFGGGITAYNIYAVLTFRAYYAKGVTTSDIFSFIFGIVLLTIGVWWSINLTRRPDAGDRVVKKIGLVFGMIGILAVGIVLTLGLVSLEVFSHSAIIIGFIPIPGQVLYALPIIFSIVAMISFYTKHK